MRNLSESTKQRIKVELNRVASEMVLEKDPDELKLLNQRYEVLSSMLKPRWKISPDTTALVVANLAGILLILNHERLDIISSKALSFISKVRV